MNKSGSDKVISFTAVCGRIVVVAAVWLALCANGAAADEPFKMPANKSPQKIRGEINVWAWTIAAGSLQKLLPLFNEKYPNIKVNISKTGWQVQQRLLLSLSAGVGAPDITQLLGMETQRYTFTGELMDLTGVAGQYEKDFVPSTWQNCLYNGKLCAIPWDFGPCAVFYKRHIFKLYGIDPNKIETWDDYIAAGKVIFEKSNGKTKMFHLPTGMLFEVYLILIQQNGGQLFDDQGRIAVNSDKSLQVMALLKRMLDSGVTVNDPLYTHAHYASLRSDSVATYPMAAWWGGTIKDYAPETKGDWGIFRLPALEPGGLRASSSGGSVLVIPDQCKNKEAVWAFVDFALCNTRAQIEQYKNFDLFPTWLPAYKDPFFDEPDPFYGGQKVRLLFAQDIEKIPPLNRTKDWPEGQAYLAQSLTGWASRGMGEPEKMLAELEKKLCRRLSREIAPTSLKFTRKN